MGVEQLIGVVILIPLIIMSAMLLRGKGAFLVAGYNLSSKEEKEQYNEKKLCKVMGGGLFLITLIVGIRLLIGDRLIEGLDISMAFLIIFITITMIILGNTICKKKDS
ncbi:MAG: DUF3784 domain-containing protein [Clostridium sp.]